MIVLPISDLHVDHMQPGTFEEMLRALNRDVDVLVVAGDVCNSGTRLPSVLGTFCEEFQHVIYVAGNHEHYNNPVAKLQAIIDGISQKYSNFYHLDNSAVELCGVRFVGSTLWFPFQESNKKFERPMADFGQIPEFRDWVYDQNVKSQAYLRNTVVESDVVITHFLPSHRSVAQQYITSPFNRFFVCPMDDMIEEIQPRVWIHGHTHTCSFYNIGDTRVVCNPFGYENIGEKSGFCPWLPLEIET
jgi:Icc-related predicted phosphoesterase